MSMYGKIPCFGDSSYTKENLGKQYIEMTKKFRRERIKGYMSEKVIANYERIIAEKKTHFPDFINGRIEQLQIKIACSKENREKNQIALNFWLKKQQEYTK